MLLLHSLTRCFRLDARLRSVPPVRLRIRHPGDDAGSGDHGNRTTLGLEPSAAEWEDCRDPTFLTYSPWGACAVDGVEFACVILPPGLDSSDPRPPMQGAAQTTTTMIVC